MTVPEKCDCKDTPPVSDRVAAQRANYLANHAAYLLGASPSDYAARHAAAAARPTVPVLSPREQELEAQMKANHLASLLGATPPTGWIAPAATLNNLARQFGADPNRYYLSPPPARVPGPTPPLGAGYLSKR